MASTTRSHSAHRFTGITAGRPALQHRGRRLRATSGPRLRPIMRLARGGNTRPGGVLAPSVTPTVRPTAHEVVVAPDHVRGAVVASAVRPAVRPAQPGVHLTDRGLLALLVMVGGLVAASAAVIVGSFFQVSNDPLGATPDNTHQVHAVAASRVNG